MRRIDRSEIDSGFVFYGDPKKDIYAIHIVDDGVSKWVAADAHYAIEHAGVFGPEAVAEIAEGVVEYDVKYLSSGAVGEHMRHNVNPTLDVRVDCEPIRIDDIFYLCHRCKCAFILSAGGEV